MWFVWLVLLLQLIGFLRFLLGIADAVINLLQKPSYQAVFATKLNPQMFLSKFFF